MRVLLVGDDANDQNLHQKGAPFYNALIAQVKLAVAISTSKTSVVGHDRHILSQVVLGEEEYRLAPGV